MQKNLLRAHPHTNSALGEDFSQFVALADIEPARAASVFVPEFSRLPRLDKLRSKQAQMGGAEMSPYSFRYYARQVFAANQLSNLYNFRCLFH